MIKDEKSLENVQDKKKKNIGKKVFELSMIVFLSLMVLLVFINALMRYIFKTSIPVSEEYARFFFMWSVFLGVIAAFQDKSHVAVTVLVDMLKGKAKTAVYLIGQLITLLVLVLLIVGGYKYTMSASTYNSVATGINYGVVVSGFVIMVIGSAFVIVTDTISELKKISKGE